MILTRTCRAQGAAIQSRDRFRPSFDLSFQFRAALLFPRGRREDRVPTSHPRSAARRCSAGKPHSSIQVVPNTRPSLRSGLTAYAVLSREPSSFWPPLPRELAMQLTRLGAPHLREKLDRSDDGQDHTVLPYARFAASPQYSSALSTLPKNCRRDEPQQRRSSTRGFGLTGTPRPARTSRIQRCLRPPQARLAIKTTRDRPSRMSRDVATDTIFPNFGKVEYFCGEGLTGGGGCFARQASDEDLPTVLLTTAEKGRVLRF